MKEAKIEIEGLLFQNHTKIFSNTINNAVNTLMLSDEQIDAELAPKLDELIANYADNISKLYLDNHKFKIENFLDSHFKNQKAIVENSKESFEAFILYINACVIVYDKIVESINGKEVNLTRKLNLLLYGLVLRRAQEIADLLIDGYIDGAMIIWRSMYENSISMLVLASENNIELSQRFYDHSIRNSKRKITCYNENFEALKFKPLPESTQINVEDQQNKMIAKYGKEFLKNDYGWADILFKGKANFKLLEEKIEMNKYRPYYVLCSEQIHSNFNGFNSYMERNKIILPRLLKQEIDLKSFIDPMQFTISILHEVNNYILWEYSVKEEQNTNLLFLKRIFEKMLNTFDEKGSS
ncbi:hypothetical protein E9993_11035 [Labilibacter sediminis]|nr:hypothetical protein E9993_11035 [Labilibacter sediminis]